MEINLTLLLNNFSYNNSGKNLFELNVNFEQTIVYWIAICVVNCFLCITALFGNSAILITIWKTSSLHSATNILLSSLAVSDLAVGLIVQPLFIANLPRLMYTNVLHFNVLSYFLCAASFATITAIGIDRLLALQLHLRYKSVVTLFRMTWVVIFIWVLSGVFSSISWLNLGLFFTVLPPLSISLLVGNFAVYLKIYLIVRRHRRQIRQQQQENIGNMFSARRFKISALNTFLVYILLLCCYLPYSVYIGVRVFSLPNFYITSVTLIFLNSSLNPPLYYWRDREIRSAMNQLFGAFFNR